MSDLIVCVQQEDNAGGSESASTLFLNLTALEADPNKECQKFAKAIRKAMTGRQRIYGSGPKMGETPDYAEDAVLAHEVTLPCLVSDFVVLFVG